MTKTPMNLKIYKKLILIRVIIKQIFRVIQRQKIKIIKVMIVTNRFEKQKNLNKNLNKCN